LRVVPVGKYNSNDRFNHLSNAALVLLKGWLGALARSANVSRFLMIIYLKQTTDYESK
jgi:hypothetical protein